MTTRNLFVFCLWAFALGAPANSAFALEGTLPADTAVAKDATVVTMKSLSYDPKVLQIKAGQSVRWVNAAYTEHSAVADDGTTFSTGMIPPKAASKPIVFSKAGTYSYHCLMHGKTMSGKIVVQ